MAKKTNTQGKTQPPIKLRDLNPPRQFVLESDYNELLALAMNAFKIECTDPNIEFSFQAADFIKQQLITANAVGYDRILNQWAICYGYGINNYWQPTELTFILPGNRQSYTRKASYTPDRLGAYLIRGLPANISLSSIVAKTADFMQECESVIYQNLEACRTPFIAVVDNEDMRLSVLQAVQERQAGQPAIVVGTALKDTLQGVQTYTDYIADRVDELRTSRLDRLLNKLGTMTANTDKRERVQTGEVNATVAQCEDYPYMLIDNVQRQFDMYDLPFKISLNTALEELYSADGLRGTTPQNTGLAEQRVEEKND